MKFFAGKNPVYLLTALFFSFCTTTFGQTRKPDFKVLAMAEPGGHHIAYSKAARVWLDSLAAKENFSIDYIDKTDPISDAYLANYQLIIQLDYVPYAWKPEAVAAFEKYIDEGKGSWIGFHHATLLGEFDGYKMWPWFSEFMGGIRYKNYIGSFAAATVKAEEADHPVMKGVPASFLVKKEEWYIYDKSPRPNVDVIASVDESTYSPNSEIKMGDHPVIWSNPGKKAKNVYIFMGHSPVLFESNAYKTIFKNAIFWAANQKR
jgi:type 1 glutamine amidotransferase